VYKAVDGLPGTTITTVSDMTSLPRSEVKKAIAALKDEGKVFQHGERRYTRYATSPTQAERASKLAQNAVKK
jgi:biotin operon repressor